MRLDVLKRVVRNPYLVKNFLNFITVIFILLSQTGSIILWKQILLEFQQRNGQIIIDFLKFFLSFSCT